MVHNNKISSPIFYWNLKLEINKYMLVNKCIYIIQLLISLIAYVQDRIQMFYFAFQYASELAVSVLLLY